MFTFPIETLSCRLPPSESGEWWEIGDESRGGIPYYYHTKTGETVWEKPNGFVIPLTVLQVRAFSRSIQTYFKPPLNRIPRSVAASPSLFLQPQIRARPHVQQDKINVPHLIVHVHIRRKPEVPPPQRRSAQLLPPCDVTLPITRRPRAWRRRFHPFLAQMRAPHQRPPPLTVPLTFPVNRPSRWLLLSSASCHRRNRRET